MARPHPKGRPTRNQVTLAEAEIARLWSDYSFSQGWLTTTEGLGVRVLFPGRSTSEAGPDFRGAILLTEQGEVWRGDIEVHRRSSGFPAHGHDQDAHYNGLILHVVLADDLGQQTRLQSGHQVPVLVLDKPTFPAGPVPLFPFPCRDCQEQQGWDKVAAVLDKAGEERFLARAAWLREELALLSPEEVLYQHLMEALGYSRNKGPFLELARRAPFAKLKSWVDGRREGERAILLEALLLEAAGLVPASSGFPGIESLPEGSWDLFRVRPGNSPVRRIAGAAILWTRFLDEGLLAGLRRLLKPGTPQEAIEKLTNSLIVHGSGQVLIGPDRARELVINGVLPFFSALGQASGSSRLSLRALKLYRTHPRLGENQITREMQRQLGLQGSRLIDSARRQQGLLHLYKTRCWELSCEGCSLNSRREELSSFGTSPVPVSRP